MSELPVLGIDASRSYRTPMTGTERYSRRIIEHMLALEHPSWRYRLYFNDPPPEHAKTGDAEIRSIPSRRLWTHYRLSRELRANPVDLLFVPSHVLPTMHPPRSVVTVHDLGYLYEPDAHTGLSRLQLRITTRWNARQASHLIAISDSTKRDLVEQCGVRPEHITVVRHGIDEQFHVLDTNTVEDYRRAAQLPDRFVLYLGTIQPRKNLVRLITAFERIAADDQDLGLVLAGNPGWKSRPIQERAETSPYRQRIRFLGYVPDDQLARLYSAAAALAIPSLYEGFGLPALEAMACGVPVVMSNRGALPELAGADARLVDPLDIDEIASATISSVNARDDGDLIRQRNGHAASYTWENAALQTRDVLWNVLIQ